MTLDRLTAPWLINPATQAVFACLAGGGHEARAVGGIVRNTLLGLPASDIDIATTALPDETLALAAKAGLKTIPTGLAHGTVTVVARSTAFEVTTLRRDVATDGRHAQVAFTGDWSADAARRDFTINALYCSADGTVFDPLGGLPDLKAGRVRFIGDANARIREDYLRILRFFRFSAIYTPDGIPDAVGLAACAHERAGLSRISGERIQVELAKLLVAPHVQNTLAALVGTGIVDAMFDGCHLAVDVPGLTRLVDIEHHLGLQPAPWIRLSAALALTPAAWRGVRDRLKLSAAAASAIASFAAPAAAVHPGMDDSDAKRALYALAEPAYRAAVLKSWTQSPALAGDLAFSHLFSLPDRWSIPRFPLVGADLLARGIVPGPRMGELLRAAEARWAAGGFRETRDDLLEALMRETGARETRG
jgi:poly(A) polymerase